MDLAWINAGNQVWGLNSVASSKGDAGCGSRLLRPRHGRPTPTSPCTSTAWAEWRVIVCGPGGRYNTMPDERIDIADYLDMVRIYILTILKICG